MHGYKMPINCTRTRKLGAGAGSGRGSPTKRAHTKQQQMPLQGGQVQGGLETEVARRVQMTRKFTQLRSEIHTTGAELVPPVASASSREHKEQTQPPSAAEMAAEGRNQDGDGAETDNGNGGAVAAHERAQRRQQRRARFQDKKANVGME